LAGKKDLQEIQRYDGKANVRNAFSGKQTAFVGKN